MATEMDNLLEERVNRLVLSVERCRAAAGLLKNSEDQVAERHYLRKESSLCLRRALALWWELRWGRK